MTYFSDFTSHQPCQANLKRTHRDSQETKPCRVEKDTKTVNTGIFVSHQYGLNTCLQNYFNQNFCREVYN